MKWEKGSNMPCGSQKDNGNIKALQIRNKQGPDHRLLHLSRAAFEDDWNPTGTSLQDWTLTSEGAQEPLLLRSLC